MKNPPRSCGYGCFDSARNLDAQKFSKIFAKINLLFYWFLYIYLPMKIAVFFIECIFNDPAVLPAQKGSILRGALGWSLKKAVCTSVQKECEACILYHTCLFPMFYAPHRDFFLQGNTMAKDIPPVPSPPFILRPADTVKTKFAVGDTLHFTLTLFGKFHSYLPYFVHAFTLMGAQGLGPIVEGKRATFQLYRIFSSGQNIYDVDKNKLLSQPDAENLVLPTLCIKSQKEEEFCVLCQTPLRFKFENHLEASLSFVQLIRLMLRRLLSLHVCYGEGRPKIDAHALLQAAEKVQIRKNSLCWLDVARYSARQQTRMHLGGLVGEIVYMGDYAYFKEWLNLLSQIHLGKQTAFGYGYINTHLLDTSL